MDALSPWQSPWILAAALVAGPLAAGFVVGALQLRLRRAALDYRDAALILVAATAMGVATTSFGVGLWDGVSLGLFFGLGWTLAAADLLRRRRRELAVSLSSLLLALALGEAFARIALPPPPGRPPIESARVFLPPVELDDPEPANADYLFSFRQTIDACAYLHPDRYPRFFDERIHRDPPPLAAVLHLGDSMTFGQGVGRDGAFPALLERRAPAIAHYNAGLPMTSVDYHYSIAAHWLDRIPVPVRLVVLNLYYNDALEIDQPLACCGDRPPIAYRDGRAVDGCARVEWSPDFGRSLAWIARSSPAPYPLRVATAVSVLARHLEAVLVTRVERMFPGPRRPDAGSDEIAGHFALVLQALRDDLARRHIPLVAVLLPVRSSLEAPRPDETEAYRIYARMKSQCDALGIPLLDPRARFAELVRRDGAARYFLGDNDIHLTPDGHAEMAEWLSQHLPPVSP